jgi:hypothetical protein
MKRDPTIFHPRVGSVWIRQKAHRDMLHRTRVFASGGIHLSRSAFRCIRGVKRGHIFFMLRWAWCGFHKMRDSTCYTEHVFLHPVGSAGHVVHNDVSGVRIVDALFFMLVWPRAISRKGVLRHVKPNLCFCIRWDLRVM